MFVLSRSGFTVSVAARGSIFSRAPARKAGCSLLQKVAEAVGATAGGDAAFSGLDHPVQHANAFANHGGNIRDKADFLWLGDAQVGCVNPGAHTRRGRFEPVGWLGIIDHDAVWFFLLHPRDKPCAVPGVGR